MTLTEGLTIAGLVFGPIAAVVVSLIAEDRRQTHARRMNVLRTLMLARSNAGDPAFNSAVNMVPMEFANDQDVMQAWEAYIDSTARPLPEGEAAQNAMYQEWGAKLEELCRALLLALGYKSRHTAKLARTHYASGAFANALQVQHSALAAVPLIAHNAGRIAFANELMLSRLAGTDPSAGPEAAARAIHGGPPAT
jgi:hypothetical protein